MRLSFRCPKCRVKYSLPHRDGIDKKRIECKKCGHAFRISEGLNRKFEKPKSAAPASDPTKSGHGTRRSGPRQKSPEPVVAQIVDPANASTGHARPQPNQPVDMSLYFVTSATKSAATSDASAQSQPTRQHVKNPWMIPAVLGAIGFSLFLAFAAFTYRIYNFAKLTRATPDFVAADTERQRPNERPQPAKHHLAKENENSSPIATDFPSAPDAGLGSHEDLQRQPKEQAKEEMIHIEAQTRLLDEQHKRHQEMLAREVEARKEREEQRAKRKIEREQQRSERDEKNRILAERKQELETMERAADNAPLQGLVARVPVESWGAQCLAISDERFAFYGTTNGVVSYDYKRSKIVTNTSDEKNLDYVEALALGHTGKLLAAGDSDGVIELFRIDRRGRLKSQGTLKHHAKTITHLTISRDDARLISVDKENKICFWDLTTKKLIRVDSSFTKDVNATQLNPEGTQVFVTDDESWMSFQIDDGKPSDSGKYPFSISPRASTWSIDLSRLIATSGSRIKVMDVTRPEPLAEARGNGVQWTVKSVGVDRFLTGGGGKVYLWGTDDGLLKHVWSMPDASYIQNIAVSSDGSKLAATSGGPRQDIYVFELH